MAGRRAKPINLHIAEGNPSHLTKAEIDKRKASEIKLGNHKLICPDYIKNDVNAYAKWKEITKIYKDVDFVSSGDTGLLARYCMTHSEYLSLLERRENISSIDYFNPEELEIIDGVFDEEFAARQKHKLFSKINYIISSEGLLSIETAINKKMDMLIKMEDRLFLNPLAKVKNVPKKEPEKQENAFDKRFGNI